MRCLSPGNEVPVTVFRNRRNRYRQTGAGSTVGEEPALIEVQSVSLTAQMGHEQIEVAVPVVVDEGGAGRPHSVAGVDQAEDGRGGPAA